MKTFSVKLFIRKIAAKKDFAIFTTPRLRYQVRLDGRTDVGVDVPDQSVGSHLDRLPLDHDLLHAAGVVDLVAADAELARPGQHRLEGENFVINFDLTLDLFILL